MSLRRLSKMAYNGKALLSGFEFEKQKYMNIDEIKAKAEMLLKNSRESQVEFVQMYNNGFEDGVNFVLQNLQQCNVSGLLPYSIYEEELNKITQLPQTQTSLMKQCEILRIFANKLGLYDAADFLRNDR